jgi:hypothetical protein
VDVLDYCIAESLASGPLWTVGLDRDRAEARHRREARIERELDRFMVRICVDRRTGRFDPALYSRTVILYGDAARSMAASGPGEAGPVPVRAVLRAALQPFGSRVFLVAEQNTTKFCSRCDWELNLLYRVSPGGVGWGGVGWGWGLG